MRTAIVDRLNQSALAFGALAGILTVYSLATTQGSDFALAAMAVLSIAFLGGALHFFRPIRRKRPARVGPHLVLGLWMLGSGVVFKLTAVNQVEGVYTLFQLALIAVAILWARTIVSDICSREQVVS